MKTVMGLFLCIFFFSESYGQLVTKRDYNAAFALQAGGDVTVLFPVKKTTQSLQPLFGLKMTFPFTRKWFMGGEVNYSRLKFRDTYDLTEYFPDQSGGTGSLEADFDLKSIQVPVYLKYMLNSNKASVLFGVYASWFFDSKIRLSGYESLDLPLPGRRVNEWNGGITLGFEQRIVKHLNLMLRLQGGVRELVQKGDFNKSLYPVQASLTLSYDIFRIGDCGCD